MAVRRQRVNSLAFSVISQIRSLLKLKLAILSSRLQVGLHPSWLSILDIILGVHIWMSGVQGDVLKTNFVSVEKCIATAEGKE